MEYKSLMNVPGFSVGDHVAKIQDVKNPRSIKFIGRLLSIYWEPHLEEWWCVVQLDENEASDRLQHLYPLRLFKVIHA